MAFIVFLSYLNSFAQKSMDLEYCNMQNIYISLPTVGVVQKFVEQISMLEGNFDLLSGGYILDARSLMGILSLDLSVPLMLSVENDTVEAMRALEPFIAKSL